MEIAAKHAKQELKSQTQLFGRRASAMTATNSAGLDYICGASADVSFGGNTDQQALPGNTCYAVVYQIQVTNTSGLRRRHGSIDLWFHLFIFWDELRSSRSNPASQKSKNPMEPATTLRPVAAGMTAVAPKKLD
ncbi:hypothetical protein [uncultured Tateyamaria sp.]|uniref:hypothetical protein n=1 Tax=uncultured Tateyamaria sp. TaxID=455651 RepID=UPI002606614C|nr:hypothetical protein [uncultured Tateyamaria sp.]